MTRSSLHRFVGRLNRIPKGAGVLPHQPRDFIALPPMHVQPATTVVAAVMPMMSAIPVMVPMPVMAMVIAVMATTVMYGNDASSPEQCDSGKQDCDQRFCNFHIRRFT